MSRTIARFTVPQALCLNHNDWQHLSTANLVFDLATRDETAKRWVWLLGLDPASEQAASARHEATSDAELFLALNLPAAEFVTWFRLDEWWNFDAAQGQEEDADAWAWALLDRARAAVRSMGSMARQLPLRCGEMDDAQLLSYELH